MLYFAPLEGITTYVYRNAFNRYYGGIDKYFSPFLTAKHIKGREKREVDPENNADFRLVPQILTNKSDFFLAVAKQLEDMGYEEVNLNLGCPSGTVVSKKRGAGLLGDTIMLETFLDEIFEAATVKISIKTRLGMESLFEWEDIYRIYKKYPISELIIHPRLGKEFYKGEVHLDSYIEAAEYFSDAGAESATVIDKAGTRFIYNGDINNIASYRYISETLGENVPYAYMIGRGLLRNPTLAMSIKCIAEKGVGVNNDGVDSGSVNNGAESSGSTDIYQDRKPDLETFKKFHDEIFEGYIKEMNYEKQAVMKMKELWSYMGEGLGADKRLLKELYKAKSPAEYRNAFQMLMSSM